MNYFFKLHTPPYSTRQNKNEMKLISFCIFHDIMNLCLCSSPSIANVSAKVIFFFFVLFSLLTCRLYSMDVTTAMLKTFCNAGT